MNISNKISICVLLSLHLQANAGVTQANSASQTNSASQESAAQYDDTTIVPESVSNAVSDVELRVRLATKVNADACVDDACEEHLAFENQVQTIASRVALAAYDVYPDLKKRIPSFDLEIIEKIDYATASNASGKIVLFRGLQQLNLSDAALNFIIAREVGHIIAKHHSKNTGTKLMISALATLLFPALGLISASSAAQQASTATSLISSAASTATSLLGSQVALARMKPSQLTQADDIAIKLLARQQISVEDVANDLSIEIESPNGWMQDLTKTVQYLRSKSPKEAPYQMPPEFVLTP